MSDDAKAAPFFVKVVSACKHIVSMDGCEVAVTAETTRYILTGRQIQLSSSLAPFRFWVGINGRRLIFTANLDSQSPYRAEQNFSSYFESLARLGWHARFELLDPGTLLLRADCMALPEQPFTEPASSGTQAGDPDSYVLTDNGAFWANDIAMLAQACLRICERHAIRCSERAPMLP